MRLLWTTVASACLALLVASALLANTSHCDVDMTGCDAALQNPNQLYCQVAFPWPLSSGNCMCCVDYNKDGVYHWVTCAWTDYQVDVVCTWPGSPIPITTSRYCSKRDPAACVLGNPPALCTAPPAGGN